MPQSIFAHFYQLLLIITKICLIGFYTLLMPISTSTTVVIIELTTEVATFIQILVEVKVEF